MDRRSGTWLDLSAPDGPYRAFLPDPLPPVPAVQLEPVMQLLSRADRAIGRLDGICSTLPDPDLFLFMYVRKEAVLSSQIEGTRSSLSDLLLFEKRPESNRSGDAAEVVRYVAAMNHGLKRLREDDFPLSLRLIREMHGKLLEGGRGAQYTPGEFRKDQNRIGGVRLSDAEYVPPPPEYVQGKLSELENFMNEQPPRLPLLLLAALVHVHFETIHPFSDGNGRIGRLLIPFILCAHGAIRKPMLYPSLYFKQHRERYYELLQAVRTRGDWEAWIEFFLTAISDTAEQAAGTADKLLKLVEADRTKLSALGRARLAALPIHAAIQKEPIFTIPEIAASTGLSHPTIARALGNMQRLEIVSIFGGRARPQLFSYESYLQLLQEGTEPLPR